MLFEDTCFLYHVLTRREAGFILEGRPGSALRSGDRMSAAVRARSGLLGLRPSFLLLRRNLPTTSPRTGTGPEVRPEVSLLAA